MNEAGEGIWVGVFLYAFIRASHGDPDAAELELRLAYEVLKKIGRDGATSIRSQACSPSGLPPGAVRGGGAAHRGVRARVAPNDVHSQILWRSVRAKTLARRSVRGSLERWRTRPSP